MIKEFIKQRIDTLRKLVSMYQYQYYVESKPTLNDQEFDKLFDELIKLEQENPELDHPHSPTKRIGSDLNNELPEEPHTIPVLSLDKVYSLEELNKWLVKTFKDSRVDITIEEKLDGSSIVLYYEKGLLVRALSRGNGKVGNNITENIKTINTIPLILENPVTCVVRGEIYIDKEDFEKYNKLSGGIYANPRNLASGKLRKLQSSEVAKVPLKCCVYEGFFEDSEYDNHSDIIQELFKLGFKISDRNKLYINHEVEIEKIDQFLKDFTDYRDKLSYEIDGLVIKVNDVKTRKELGYSSHHPKWAIAYKFKSPESTSVIKSVEVRVGRSGKLCPLAYLEPFELAGSIITKATLHNQDYINTLELAIGDTVAVSKRGDIIPAVEEVIEKNTLGNVTFKLPIKCPSCGKEIIKDGAHNFCINKECRSQIVNKLKFFTEKQNMDIEFLGSKTVEYLFDIGMVKTVKDFYTCDYNQLIGHEGFGKRKVEKLKQSIDESKKQPFSRVLPSLGFNELGHKTTELLIENGYNSFSKMYNAFCEEEISVIQKIGGFGPKTIKSLIDVFNNQDTFDLLSSLDKLGLNLIEIKQEEKEMVNNKFKDTSWVITGSFENYKPRDLAKDEIINRGGKISSGVSKNTTYLLCGEKAGSKLTKAESLGIKIVKEQEFLKMIT